MNLPNRLTTSRIIMAFAFLAALVSGVPYGKTIAFFLFVIASITDALDGYYARKYNLFTDFGKLMDPLADKILISAAFISFVQLPETRVPAWIAVVVVAREFAVTGLRLLGASKGMIIGAHRWGKNKMVSQVFTAGIILAFLAANELLPNAMGKVMELPFLITKNVLVYATVTLTAVTGILFLSKHRGLMLSGV
jgi:CDP-diacylglycerol--glycerol-3-phosphate 3-phosphatidyltransferase